MALTFNEIKRKQRPWGFEIRGLIKNNGIDLETVTPHWPSEPTSEQLSAWVAIAKIIGIAKAATSKVNGV